MTACSTKNTPDVPKPKSQQVAEIQGLRGVAIIAVLLFHLWAETFEVGFLGVDIFFVISGYLMCLLLSRHSSLTPDKVVDFYYRRIKRILPIYLFVIWAVLMTGVFCFIYPIDYSPLLDETVRPLMFIANIPDSNADDYFIQSMGSYSFFRHLWSLSVELQFYSVVPALIWVLSWFSIPIRSLVVTLLAGVSYWLQSHSEANDEHMALHSRVWQFMFGFLAYYGQQTDITSWLNRKIELPNKLAFYLSAFAQLILTLVLVSGVSFDLTGDKQGNRLILLVVVSLLIARPSGNLLLASPGLVWLGNVSYSVYLVHWPLFQWQRYSDVKMYSFNGKTTVFAGLVLIAVSIFVGHVIEKTYERVSPWINSWRRLLFVIAFSYAVISATCFYLVETSYPQTFQLDRNHVVENPQQLAAETIKLWTNRNSTPRIVDPREIVETNNKFQYLTWNLITCKHPQKELLPTTANMSRIPLVWTCVEDEGTGDKNIVVIGNSHARSYYFGLEFAFRGVYKHMAMMGTPCPLVAMDLEKEGGSLYSYKRCMNFRGNVFRILEGWKQTIDIIIVGTNYHQFIDYKLATKQEEDPALRDLDFFYGNLAKFAREVVFVPQIQFETGVTPHTATLQRKILYENDLSPFRSPSQMQTARLPYGQERLRMVNCTNCVKINWFDLYCNWQSGTCDSIDFKTKFSYFFDGHHVNAYGSLNAGEFVRRLYDQWRDRNSELIERQKNQTRFSISYV